MNILLISWYFPPGNDVAALRTGALAEFLEKKGHTVHVLTSERDHSDASLPVPVDESRIARTRWFDVDHWRLMPRPMYDPQPDQSAEAAQSHPKIMAGKLRAGLASIYYNTIHTPDRQIGWLPYAVAEGTRIFSRHSIDLIYASAPPFTGYLAARSLGRHFSVPWIAEYRDGWSRYVYVPRPGWRQWIDEKLENLTVGNAAGIVAVTESWGDYYSRRFRKPTMAIPNGFDERMLASSRTASAPDEPVTITYVGVLYQGLRDPSVLYEAIRQAGLRPGDLQIDYYGPSAGEVFPLAKAHGVDEFVRVLPRVSFAQSLDIQRASDVLLLLQSPVDPRNVPAKLFEYFAARRPILGIGLDNGEPARLITERKAGFYRSDPAAIALQLRAWVAEKRRTGSVVSPPESSIAGLSRGEQFARLEEFITRVRTSGSNRADSTKVALPAGRTLTICADRRPLILTTVDAEEEFDWYKPLARANRSVLSMREQYVLHRTFEKYGVVPIYFATYPIVTQDDGSAFLADCLKDGRCQIGSQLHPWVTPPYDEIVNAYNSFAGNLPESLEFTKLKTLTEAIAERFGVRPTAYRAGRYGIGPHTVKALGALGYRIDSSVVPEFSYHRAGGPVFFNRPTMPYWLDPERRLLEVPLTSTTVGRLTGGAHPLSRIASGLFADDERYTLSRAVMARTGLIERIRLTPEGTEFADSKRLVRALLKRGTRIFTLSYHTPSLVPGNTPYVRSEADRQRFLAWFEEFYEFFLGEIGGVPAKVSDVYDLACAAEAAPSRLPAAAK